MKRKRTRKPGKCSTKIHLGQRSVRSYRTTSRESPGVLASGLFLCFPIFIETVNNVTSKRLPTSRSFEFFYPAATESHTTKEKIRMNTFNIVAAALFVAEVLELA